MPANGEPRTNRKGTPAVLPASDLLRFRRHNETLEDFGERLGRSLTTLHRWTKQVDSMVTLADASYFADRLQWHPIAIWGDAWTEAVLASDPSDLLADLEGLTNAEAARRCGVSSKTIAAWRRHGYGRSTAIDSAAENLANFPCPNSRKHA